MPRTVTLQDESASGQLLHERVLFLDHETLSVRQLIEQRVYEEVREANRSSARRPVPGALVEPTETERSLNAEPRRKPRKLDWRRQADAALAAFERNGFFLLVDERQLTRLDETIELRDETRISFVKLVPLVGG